MFCPRCSTQNISDQKYCRQCGLPLAPVRLAVEGYTSDAVEKLKKAQRALYLGMTAIFALIFIIIGMVLAGGRLGSIMNPITVSIVVGLTVWIIIGLVRVQQANKLLSAQDQSKRLATDRLEGSGVKLSATPTTDPVLAKAPIPASVTEHTTLELKPSADGRE